MHVALTPPESNSAYPQPTRHELRWNAQLDVFTRLGTPCWLSQYALCTARHAAKCSLGGGDGEVLGGGGGGGGDGDVDGGGDGEADGGGGDGDGTWGG